MKKESWQIKGKGAILWSFNFFDKSHPKSACQTTKNRTRNNSLAP